MISSIVSGETVSIKTTDGRVWSMTAAAIRALYISQPPAMFDTIRQEGTLHTIKTQILTVFGDLLSDEQVAITVDWSTGNTTLRIKN